MIMALENSGLAITGDSIKTKLLQEVEASAGKTAFIGRKPFPPRQKKGVTEDRSADPPKGPKCKRCSKYGHIARDCRSKKGSAFCTVLATDAGVTDDCWIFDSGASDHFTKNRSLLMDDRAASGVVMAADKGAMNIVATGAVNLKPKCCPEGPITVNNVKLAYPYDVT